MDKDVILFDINETVLSLASLKAQFKAQFGSEEIVATWFSMVLHSSTVCSCTGVKTDFSTLAKTMLDAVAAKCQITLTAAAQDELLESFASLPPHPDMEPALQRLQEAGFKTVAFSNSSERLIATQIDNSGLADLFDDVVSVEATGSFKPDPAVYHYVAEQLGLPTTSLRLVATHDWDTHGALHAGLKAAYIDRSGVPYHPLYQQPDIIADNMLDIAEQIIRQPVS